MSQLRKIHLINPLWNAAGGSEQRTIELFRELSPHALVQLWSDSTPDPEFASAYPIQQLAPADSSIPRGGTIVFIGTYRPPGSWIAAAQPRRTIVVYNIRAPRVLVGFMKHLFAQGVAKIEVVYASELLQRETRLRGIVEPSPIDLSRFTPLPQGTQRNQSLFAVGRLSREDPRKHHPEDPSLYHRLVETGSRVRIMGGTGLTQLPAAAGIELLPPKAEPAELFLHSLDCFFYRTSEQIWETFGRVVHEAMACGLPVVCHRRGGYVTSIDHGRTGFLFDTTDEALAILHNLQHNPSLRRSIGSSARAAMEAMYSPAERAKIIDYYLM